MITSCHALKKIDVDATSVQFASHSFGFQPDNCLNLQKVSNSMVKVKIREFLKDAGQQYDLFHFHDMPKGHFTPDAKDIAILKKSSKPIIIQHHGSEVRRLSIARSFNNPYVKVKGYWRNEKKIISRLRQWGELIDYAIIADHELLPYIKDYYKSIHIIRQPIDVSQYSPSYPNSKNDRPIIVHAPSHTDIKGTIYINEAVTRLKNEGFSFDFHVIQKTNHETARQKYQQADIIVDQLLIGAYGTLSLEGMALGKPVICYIREDLLVTYPKNLPIISANPDTIYEQLKILIVDSVKRNEIGKKSRDYVEKYHDSILIAEQLKAIYEKVLKENQSNGQD
ncbi:glycosyltransferase family 4 protein [Fredinandcohnia sp. 179-A 10B2 NHS]|uniref:glycosyltransferase family 4 protein n=1 Tax=Fredinandcohnia sp. 179-A 10B2 NHS TaxID=3235176 RepID=UPI00399F0C6A